MWQANALETYIDAYWCTYTAGCQRLNGFKAASSCWQALLTQELDCLQGLGPPFGPFLALYLLDKAASVVFRSDILPRIQNLLLNLNVSRPPRSLWHKVRHSIDLFDLAGPRD